MEHEQLYSELIHLAQQKEIPYTKRELDKMSPEKRQQVYEDYKRKELDDFNEAITDIVIVKIDDLMKTYDLIKKDSKLAKRLQDKKLFRNDLKNLVSYITPVLPLIGFLEGGVTIASEMYEKMKEEEPKEEESEE